MGTIAATETSKDDAFAAARDAAAGDAALLALMDDAAAKGSRRMQICSICTDGGNYCY